MRFQFKPEKIGIPDLDDFLRISGVKEVTFNKITKTLLIIYDQKKLNLEKLILEIQKRMPEFDILKTELRKDNFSAKTQGNNVLGEMIFSTGSKFNQKIYKLTKGYTDLVSLYPAVSIFLGLEELIRRPQMPSWNDLMWIGHETLWHKYASKENQKLFELSQNILSSIKELNLKVEKLEKSKKSKEKIKPQFYNATQKNL